jgi:hypothetical protein
VTAPVVTRAFVIGTVGKVERKTVSDSALAEFYLEDFGIRINAWKGLAEKVPAPGKTVMVEGSMRTRSYTVDDKPRQTTEITASSIEELGTATAATAPAAAPTGAQLPDGGF